MEDLDLGLNFEDCDLNVSLDEDLLNSILNCLPETASENSFSAESPATNCAVKGTSMQCQVCGNEASKHNHYGASVCQSCRAFFRRSVQSGKSNGFSCKSGSSSCQIDSKSWKSCKKCRYDRCLSAGMKPSWVLNDGQINARKPRTPVSKANRNFTKKNDKPCPMILALPSNRLFSLVEVASMKNLNEQFFEYSMCEMCEMLSLTMHGVTPKKPLSLKVMRGFESFVLERLSYFFEQLSDFNKFCLDDRIKLLLTNTPYFVEILRPLGLSNARTHKMFLEKTYSVISSKAKEDADMAFTERKLLELNVGKKGRSPNIDYGKMYKSLWRGSSDERHETISAIFSELLNDNTDTFDAVLISLLCLYILFSGEDLNMKNQKQSEDLQASYLDMIQRYLREKYPASVANRKTMQIVHIRALAKESYDIRIAKETSLSESEDSTI